MSVSQAPEFVDADYKPRKTHRPTPMATLTDAEAWDLPSVIELRSSDKAALLDSARAISQGVLSLWSYEGLQSEIQSPAIISRRPKRAVSRLLDSSSEDARSSRAARPMPVSKPEASTRPRHPELAVLKRHRGRPKLGLSPQMCAERRRAQLRKAQRGLRSRQGATVAFLEQRNRDLEKVIDGMTRSFLDLQELTMKVAESHLSVELAHQLQKGSDDFLALARTAYEENEEGG